MADRTGVRYREEQNGILARKRWLAVLPTFAAMLNSYL